VVFFSLICLANEDISDIIRRSVQANARDWQASPQYDCSERDQDPHGASKTYQDLIVLGSPYQKLIKIDGKPLSVQEQQREQQKLETAISERRHESVQERAQRIAKYEKERRRDNELMDQLTKAFDFTLAGEQTLDGYDVYVLKAKPRRGYRPPTTDTEVLKGMEGELWIDKQTYQWVKVEAHVIHPVSIEGFMARVEPGTRFELEKMPVDDNIWLAKHFSMKAHAKVFFLFSHNEQQDEWYFDYHKASDRQEQ